MYRLPHGHKDPVIAPQGIIGFDGGFPMLGRIRGHYGAPYRVLIAQAGPCLDSAAMAVRVGLGIGERALHGHGPARSLAVRQFKLGHPVLGEGGRKLDFLKTADLALGVV